MTELKGSTPVPVVDATLSASGNGAKWNADSISKLIQSSTPIVLAVIAFLTFLNGQKTDRAAQVAARSARATELVRQDMIRTDSATGVVLDTIHSIVNSQRTRMEAQNEALRYLLEKNGVRIPPGLVAPEPKR